jgi:hypothetical protein
MTVNRMVAGSNPARGASNFSDLPLYASPRFLVAVFTVSATFPAVTLPIRLRRARQRSCGE